MVRLTNSVLERTREFTEGLLAWFTACPSDNRKWYLSREMGVEGVKRIYKVRILDDGSWCCERGYSYGGTFEYGDSAIYWPYNQKSLIRGFLRG